MTTKLEQAARQIIVDWDSGIHLYEAITALREALAEPDWEAIGKEQMRRYEEKFGAIPVEPVKQEPVAKVEVKNWGGLKVVSWVYSKLEEACIVTGKHFA